MILLHLTDTTGPEVYAAIEGAIKRRKEALGRHVSKAAFAEAAGISRATIYRFGAGENPTMETLHRVAAGMRVWGEPVKLVTN